MRCAGRAVEPACQLVVQERGGWSRRCSAPRRPSRVGDATWSAPAAPRNSDFASSCSRRRARSRSSPDREDLLLVTSPPWLQELMRARSARTCSNEFTHLLHSGERCIGDGPARVERTSERRHRSRRRAAGSACATRRSNTVSDRLELLPSGTRVAQPNARSLVDPPCGVRSPALVPDTRSRRNLARR